jgi:YD repeat-containing protein
MDKTVSYAYDAAGQLTTFADPDGNETRIAYDDASRLAEVAHPNGVTERRTYDQAGRLAAHRGCGPDSLVRDQHDP